MEIEVLLVVIVVVMMMVQPQVTMACEVAVGVAYAAVLMVKDARNP